MKSLDVEFTISMQSPGVYRAETIAPDGSGSLWHALADSEERAVESLSSVIRDYFGQYVAVQQMIDAARQRTVTIDLRLDDTPAEPDPEPGA